MTKGRTSLLNSSGSLLNLAYTILHGLNGILCILLNTDYYLGDFSSRFLGLLSQLANLFCNYGKASAMLTSPSSLNSRIQSQQIGLLRNGGNSINNHTYLLRFLTQLLNNPRNIRYCSIYGFHIAYSTAYIGTACFCHIIGFMYLVYSLSQGCRELFHMGCKIVHTVGSCLHLIELLITTACHIHNRLGNRLADCCCLLRSRGQLLRSGCQVFCSSYNLLHQLRLF